MLIPIGFLGAGGAAGSYELISTIYGNGSGTQIDFTSVPSTYKHLQLRFVSTVATDTDAFVRFNSDTGANYRSHWLRGNGSTVTSSTDSFSGIYVTGSTGGFIVSGVVDILDYASTNKNKTVRALTGVSNTTKLVALHSGAWFSTSAVSTISFRQGGFAFPSTSRFSLYGIK